MYLFCLNFVIAEVSDNLITQQVNKKVKVGYKNMSSLTQEQLNKSLWAAADDMRKSMSADDYKDYLLGLVFFKEAL